MSATKYLLFPRRPSSAQLAEVDIHTHIRAAIWTSGPAFIVALVVFAILGLRETGVTGGAHIAVDLAQLDQIFWIRPLNLVPPIVLLILSLRPNVLSVRARCHGDTA
jgi:NhaC family Na+:H+ antiporter